MRIGIFVFSGTGNTRHVCSAIKEHLASAGHEVIIHGMSDAGKAVGFDCIIIGYPVHAFNAPRPVISFMKKLPMHAFNAPLPVISFMKKLPRADGKPIYMVQTSGEALHMNAAASLRPMQIASRKGYRALGAFSYVMPYNIIFRHSEEMAARMLETAKRRAPHDAAAIARLERIPVDANLLDRAVSLILRIEHPAMPIIGQHFRTTDSCIGCGRCALNCPQGNIMMAEGRPVFGHSCSGCMGCAFTCPEDAIRISILDGWRVNGPYRWDGKAATDDEVCSYCRRSYLRYFHKYEDNQ